MKAILIDPVARSVTEVEYEGGLDSLYRLLDCQRVDALHLNGNIFEDGWNSVFIDDEALLDEENAPRHYFEIETERGWSPPVGSTPPSSSPTSHASSGSRFRTCWSRNASVIGT